MTRRTTGRLLLGVCLSLLQTRVTLFATVAASTAAVASEEVAMASATAAVVEQMDAQVGPTHDGSSSNGSDDDDDNNNQTASTFTTTAQRPLSHEEQMQHALQVDALVDDVVQWIKDNGAYVNDKVEVRRQDPSDPNSVRGMFTNAPIFKGEKLLTVPWDLIVHPTKYDHKDPCETISKIFHQLRNTDGSQTPYGRYLLTQPRNYLPALWTDAGKQLLGEILRYNLPPHFAPDYDYIDTKLYHLCDAIIAEDIDTYGIDNIDWDLYEHAWLLVESRADDELMIPFYDMINHSNDPALYNSIHDLTYNESLTLLADFDLLEPGTQLHISYNRCNNCGTRHDWFGTPEMLDSYGFVENYPHTFLFDDDETDMYRLKFKIEQAWIPKEGAKVDEEDSDDESVDDYTEEDYEKDDRYQRAYTATFLAPPSPEGVEFMKRELNTLLTLEEVRPSITMEDFDGIRQFEWDQAWRLHDAYIVAFRTALHEAENFATLSNAVFSADEDTWFLIRDWPQWFPELYDGDGYTMKVSNETLYYDIPDEPKMTWRYAKLDDMLVNGTDVWWKAKRSFEWSDFYIYTIDVGNEEEEDPVEDGQATDGNEEE